MEQKEILEDILKVDAELLKLSVQQKMLYDQLYTLMRKLRKLANHEKN